MNTNLENNIELYLKNKLSDSEKQSLESQLSQNDELKNLFEKHRLVHILVEERKLSEIKKLANEVHQESQRNIKIVRIGIGVGIIAMLIAVVYFAQKQASSDYGDFKEKIELDSVKVDKSLNQEVIINTPNKKNLAVLKINQSQVVKERNDSVVVESSHRNSDISTSVGKDSTKDIDVTHLTPQASEVEQIDPCTLTQLHIQLFATSTCPLEKGGSITISSVIGGKPPYVTHIYDFDGQEYRHASELPKGVYTVLVKDANSCEIRQSVEVKQKNCPLDVAFSPLQGERWEIPSFGKAGALSIVDKGGNVYFSANIQKGVIEYWDGKSNLSTIKTGYYLYYIKFEDGTLQKGSITIAE